VHDREVSTPVACAASARLDRDVRAGSADTVGHGRTGAALATALHVGASSRPSRLGRVSIDAATLDGLGRPPTPQPGDETVAEIPIQEKRGGGGSKLPLIIGGLLLLLLLGWCLTRDRDVEPTPADTATVTAPATDTALAPAPTATAPGTDTGAAAGTGTGTSTRP
jgi:hypothetical protein